MPSPCIISASRRTDIPAFYGQWFSNRLKAGCCTVRNPFSKQPYQVSLARENVLAWVFWSRNYSPFMNTLRDLHGDGHRFLCNFTINGFPRILESNTPSAENAIPTAQQIAKDFSPDVISWRYDPIVLSSVTTPDWHIQNFTRLAESMKGATRRCYFSFPCLYQKTRRNLAKTNDGNFKLWSSEEGDFSPDDLKQLSKDLAGIAQAFGITMYSCCDGRWVDDEIPIYQAHCVDWPLLRTMLEERKDPKVLLNPTRKECGCYKSVDIGRYETCAHGCVYCYAVGDRIKAQENLRRHDPQANEL